MRCQMRVKLVSREPSRSERHRHISFPASPDLRRSKIVEIFFFKLRALVALRIKINPNCFVDRLRTFFPCSSCILLYAWSIYRPTTFGTRFPKLPNNTFSREKVLRAQTTLSVIHSCSISVELVCVLLSNVPSFIIKWARLYKKQKHRVDFSVAPTLR